VKVSDKVVLGVIICGVAYVCVSPFLQLIVPAPSTPVSTDSTTAQADGKALKTVSGAGQDLNVADAIIHLNDPPGDKDEAMRQRFLEKLHSVQSDDGRLEAERLLKELANEVTAGHTDQALKLTDPLLTFLQDHPHLDKRYCVLTNTLGLQMAYKAGLKERASAYGKAAHSLSRQIDDYMIDRIEPTYFRSIGIEADFDGIDQAFKRFDDLFAARNLEGLSAVSSELEDKVVGLPADSFEHLRADMYSAYAAVAGGGSKTLAQKQLEEVAQRADTAGDTSIAAKCKAMAAAIAKL
jgi:hypothetical protein